MHRIAVAAWLGLLLAPTISAALAKDPDNFDPAARAELISRFIADDAVVVGHVDVTRLKIEPLFAALKRLAPADDGQIEFTQATVEQSVEQFLKAGGREAFVVLTPSLSPLLVVPLAADADEAMILAILGQAPLETVEKFDGALVAGTEEAVSRLRGAKPAAREGLNRAFAVAGDTVAQVLLIPTENDRQRVEKMLPRLPPALGGASTRAVARGMNLAALGIDGPPQFSLRLVADAVDAAAAEELKTLVGGLLDVLCMLPEVQKMFPDQDGLRKSLSPKVSQNQVVLELSGQQVLGQIELPVTDR